MTDNELTAAGETPASPQAIADKRTCPRCKMPAEVEAEFCPHCGLKIGEHRRVRWWHVHRLIYNWTIAWAYKPSAAVGLFALSFAESSFFPVPPDVLLIPLVLGNRKKYLRYALLCSIASITGGIFGYCVGIWLWSAIHQSAYNWFAWAGFTPQAFARVSDAYDRYNFAVVFTAGFTPLPFKLITITAGVFEINFLVFVIAAAVSRSARFFAVAWLMHHFGPKITPFIDKYFNWLALLFVALLIGGFVAVQYSF